MNKMKNGAVVLLMAVATSGPALAAPAPSASSAAPDGYALKEKSMGADRTDALAQKNAKLAKCQSMKGSEKAGCVAQAKADAKGARKKDSSSSGGDGSRK